MNNSNLYTLKQYNHLFTSDHQPDEPVSASSLGLTDVITLAMLALPYTSYPQYVGNASWEAERWDDAISYAKTRSLTSKAPVDWFRGSVFDVLLGVRQSIADVLHELDPAKMPWDIPLVRERIDGLLFSASQWFQLLVMRALVPSSMFESRITKRCFTKLYQETIDVDEGGRPYNYGYSLPFDTESDFLYQILRHWAESNLGITSRWDSIAFTKSPFVRHGAFRTYLMASYYRFVVEATGYVR